MTEHVTEHVTEDLPLLLTGEATREMTRQASEHLRGCDDCRQDLAGAVTAHAALASAQRFAKDLMTAAETSAPSTAAADLPSHSADFPVALAEFAARTGHSRRRRYLVGVAAAAVIAAGATVGAVTLTSSGSAGRNVALAPFGAGTRSAAATIAGDRIAVDAASLPTLDAAHRYEVWLTDPARTRMQPVGWIDTSGRATMTVPQALLHTYADIEVSVQQVDGPYIYSGTSVLRGSYS
jgi:hypothetical protein